MIRTRQETKHIVGQHERVVIRDASATDAPALFRLAAMDGKRPLNGRVVVAEADGEILAAVSVESGSPIADPWTHTDGLVQLLELRAGQLREARPAARREHRRPRLAALGA